MRGFFQLAIWVLFFSLTKTLAQDFDFVESKTTLGGYGEMHFNSEKIEGNQSSNVLDFHRFVIFFGYNWNEKWSFKSEVEIEHNFVSNDQGELALEQAYINYQHADYLGIQAGVLLPSIGLLNEFHEPPLFFGVERPDYQSRIIPTTWYGNGIALYGNFNGFDYKFTVLEGLNSDNFSNSSGIRGGRQNGFKSRADNLLYNVRLNYLDVPGLFIGTSFTYNRAKGDSTEVPLTIMELHAKYEANNIYSVFEIGNINYDDRLVKSSFGYYFDLGYNIAPLISWDVKLIPFFRYSDTNPAATLNTNSNLDEQYHFKQWMLGFSFKPIDQIVFKFDYSQRTRAIDNQKTDLLNLGLGYMF